MERFGISKYHFRTLDIKIRYLELSILNFGYILVSNAFYAASPGIPFFLILIRQTYNEKKWRVPRPGNVFV